MRMSRSVVSAVLILVLIAVFQSFMIAGPGADVLGNDTEFSIDASGEKDWFGFIREGGPLTERIPAPYVVFTVLIRRMSEVAP